MDTKELQDKLDTLKSALETSLTEKAKAEITLQLKAVTEELAAIKKAMETTKPDEATAKLVKEMGEKLEAIQKAADLNQPVIDAFVKSPDKHIKKEIKSFGENLAEAVQAQVDDIEKFRRKETKSFIIELKTVGDMTISNVTGGSRYGQIFAPRIIETPNRRFHVRQALPVSAAGPGNTFTFMKENGAGEGAIAPTAETAEKPQIDLDLIEATVNFEVIAGWLRISRKMLNNVPGMTSFLQSRLPEKLLRVEDAQILYGNGVTPNLKGIGTSGNFTAALDPSGNGEMTEALINAISQLEDTNERYATAILVRPRAYYNFFKQHAVTSGLYDLPKNFIYQGNVLYISGVPVYPTTAVNSGDYFVGDFEMGAALLVQEGMRIEFFEQDGINVRENKVTVRIEETVALPVYGSDYFIKGNDSDLS